MRSNSFANYATNKSIKTNGAPYPSGVSKIFYNNINKITKNPKLDTLQNEVGNIKILPSYSKEWKNLIYSFNKNNLKNLPLDTLFINKIIKNYFDAYLKNDRESKLTIFQRKKTFLNKIYISNVDIQHTNKKSKITLYTINKEREYLKSNYFVVIKKINKILFSEYIKKYQIFWLQLKKILFTANAKSGNTVTNENLTFMTSKNLNKAVASLATLGKINKNLYFQYKFQSLRIFIKLNQLFMEKFWNNLVRKQYSNSIEILQRFDLLYSLNLLKFNNKKLLPKLSKVLVNIVSKGKSKKIEYNIVNLKSLTFNSDIFTNISAKMVKIKPLMHPLRIINCFIRKVKLPQTNTIQERTRIFPFFNKDLLRNKYKDFRILSNILRNLSTIQAGNKSNISKFLNNLFKSSSSDIIDNYNIYSPISLQLNKKVNPIKNRVFRSVYYKNMSGIRVEVKGRLSKRFRADRAAYHVNWKGGLRNIYSSYKGLSAVLFRGNMQPQVSKTIVKSTRRIGAFAVKGWIAAK